MDVENDGEGARVKPPTSPRESHLRESHLTDLGGLEGDPVAESRERNPPPSLLRPHGSALRRASRTAVIRFAMRQGGAESAAVGSDHEGFAPRTVVRARLPVLQGAYGRPPS